MNQEKQSGKQRSFDSLAGVNLQSLAAKVSESKDEPPLSFSVPSKPFPDVEKQTLLDYLFHLTPLPEP